MNVLFKCTFNGAIFECAGTSKFIAIYCYQGPIIVEIRQDMLLLNLNSFCWLL